MNFHQSLPEGFLYFADYISDSEHDKIWKILNSSDFVWDSQPQRRQVKQYGVSYNYRKQRLDKTQFDPIPDFVEGIIRKLVEDKIFSTKPDHIIINKYLQNGNRNWSIPPHIDSAEFFGNIIASLTLGNSCVVEFCKAHHEEEKNIMTAKVFSKSLYVMTGESRYIYYHRIPDKKYNLKRDLNDESNARISLTFRNLK